MCLSWRRENDVWMHTCGWQAVAVGSTFVAVATSKRMLRLFTTSGLQTRIIMLNGPVLSMHGLHNELALLCHSPCSPGADGSQDVHFQWLNVDSKTTVAAGPVCLSPKAKLEWLQITDLGFLAIMDSAGMVCLYSPAAAQVTGQWNPVLDVTSLEKEKKMHKRDWFWPVAITQDHIVGVLVKEEKRYPDTNMPVMSKFPLAVPLLGANEQEESFVRNTLLTERQAGIAADEDDEAAVETARLQLHKTLLQQFNMACIQKKLVLALDLAKLFSSEKGVQAAATLANRHKLTNLAERIDMYRQVRFQEVEDEDEVIEYEEDYEHTAAKRSKHQYQERQEEQEDEDDDSRQQV